MKTQEFVCISEVKGLDAVSRSRSQEKPTPLTPQLTEELNGSGAQTKFLDEYSEIIAKLMTLGTPHYVHHLLELIQKLAPVDPARCFDLIAEAMLRTTGVARYEHESMGLNSPSILYGFISRTIALFSTMEQDVAS